MVLGHWVERLFGINLRSQVGLVGVAFAQQSVTRCLKMLRDAPMSGLVKPRCADVTGCGCRLWAVPSRAAQLA